MAKLRNTISLLGFRLAKMLYNRGQVNKYINICYIGFEVRLRPLLKTGFCQ